MDEIEREKITIKDIEHFFPYLKNLEDQVVDPDDFCAFQTEITPFEEEEDEQEEEIFSQS